MKKIKLTCAHAIVKHLIAKKILIDHHEDPDENIADIVHGRDRLLT